MLRRGKNNTCPAGREERRREPEVPKGNKKSKKNRAIRYSVFRKSRPPSVVAKRNYKHKLW